jgi:hypothetical protein
MRMSIIRSTAVLLLTAGCSLASVQAVKPGGAAHGEKTATVVAGNNTQDIFVGTGKAPE